VIGAGLGDTSQLPHPRRPAFNQGGEKKVVVREA
jgi:hypothetical protein